MVRCEMKNCTPLRRQEHFQVKMYKTQQVRTTFGSCDVEKVHAVAARRTFRSQNVQSTPLSDHFWKLRWRKSARRCVAKHVKSGNTEGYGALLEVRTSFCVAGTKRAKREGFVAVSTTTTTQHYIALHSTPLHSTPVHSTPLHSTTTTTTTTTKAALQLQLHYTTLGNITLHCAHYTTANATATALTLHYTNYTTAQLQLQLHYTTTTTTAALHHATSVVGGVTDQATTATFVTTPKTNNSNHLSVHQWICSAIHASQQLTSLIVPYL